jgi:hypothetical protein
MMNKYGYAAEKLAAARRALMLPHPNGEPRSILTAYMECILAFNGLDRDKLPEDPSTWIHTIEELMDTTGIPESDRGTGIVKAERMTVEERSTFSHAVDELAWWFSHHS